MSIAWTRIARDLRRAWTSGGLTMPLGFYLLTAVMFPFAVGPDGALLARIGGGVAWTAALLAALLPVERLISPDIDSGVVDQLIVRGWSETTIAAAKIAGHWLGFGPAMLAAAAIVAAMMGVETDALLRIELGLLIGTPGLAALGVATGALVAGLRGAGAIAGLVMLPFALPILIFGAGAIEGGGSALKLLAATSLLLVAGAPVVAGTAMRFARG